MNRVALQTSCAAPASAFHCTSVMLQIDANMLSYAGRALHRHGIGASGALGAECCGPRDASSVPRCYAPFRVSEGRPMELNFASFACAPTRRVRDW